MTHKFREDGSHYNGSAVFFGYGYRAIEEPRLKSQRSARLAASRETCAARSATNFSPPYATKAPSCGDRPVIVERSHDEN